MKRLNTLLSVCTAVCLLVACSDPKFSELPTKAVQGISGAEPIEPTPPPAPEVPPQIVLVDVPDHQLPGGTATVVFEVIEGSSPISEVNCAINGVDVSCDDTGDTITVEDVQTGDHVISIVAVDENDLSDEEQVDWVVGTNLPPNVVLVQVPTNQDPGGDTQVVYEVRPGTSPVVSVVCQVDGAAVPCSRDGGTINISDVQPGEHQVVVTAVDQNNLRDQESAEWVVAPHRPPSILLVQVPDDHPSGSSATVIFQVLPGTSPIAQVSCAVDGSPVECDNGGDTIIVPNVQPGDHSISIVAVDEQSLSDQEIVSWSVSQNFERVRQPVVVEDEDDQVDVLVVIDNSRSMRFEQQSMADKIGNFLRALNGLDWRLGVTITDPRVDHRDIFNGQFSGITVQGDGQLQKMQNGEYWISSSQNLDEAERQFSSVILRQETQGWHMEQGIKMATRAVQRSIDSSERLHSVHNTFFREKAALAVIVISDEDESFDSVHFPFSRPENHGAELLSLVQNTWGVDKLFQFHSIITRPGDNACQQNSNANQFGFNYQAFTDLTGGTVGSVCEQDYSAQLELIGQDVSRPNKRHELDCAPMDIDGNNLPDVTVTVNNGQPVPNYTIDGRVLTFSSALKPGDYDIQYFCPL